MAALRPTCLNLRLPKLGFLLVIAFLAACDAAAPGNAPPPPTRPGNFDYYVLSLSWSPEYCAGRRAGDEEIQCAPGRRFGFLVHGLWPQFERGYPEFCDGPALAEELIPQMLPLMPSPALIRHQWKKHGTCSGLTPEAYFSLIEKAFGAVLIPAAYRRPERYLTVEPERLKADFATENGWEQNMLTVHCSGRFLRELRLCLTRDLKPRPCGAGLRDSCREEKIVLRPVR